MVDIGIKVSPEEIYYTISKKLQYNKEILYSSNLVVPKALDIPDKLSFIRNTLISVINQYSVQRASLKIIEKDIKDENIINLIKLEGIIQELLSTSGVEIWKYAQN